MVPSIRSKSQRGNSNQQKAWLPIRRVRRSGDKLLKTARYRFVPHFRAKEKFQNCSSMLTQTVSIVYGKEESRNIMKRGPPLASTQSGGQGSIDERTLQRRLKRTHVHHYYSTISKFCRRL